MPDPASDTTAAELFEEGHSPAGDDEHDPECPGCQRATELQKSTRQRVEWFFEFDGGGSKNLLREFIWLVRNGDWAFGRNRPWMFGAGRVWYDGPYWYFHIGPVGTSLGCK